MASLPNIPLNALTQSLQTTLALIEKNSNQDVVLVLSQTQQQIDQIRKSLLSCPGFEFSEAEQLRKIEALKKQVEIKDELIRKYIAVGTELLH